MYKIIGGDGKEYGPISADQIHQWIVQNRVNAQTKVKAEGGDWKPLSDFPEFAGSLGNRLQPSVPPGLPPLAPMQKTSAMAVTSLVLGILGLVTCGVTALVGLILGIVAMNRIKKSNGALGGFGIALAGTIVSGVFLLMIPIQAAMLLPALAKAKQRAQTVQCVNNMKQLALAVRIYSGDHSDHFPPSATWCDAIKPEVGSDKVFKCVAANNNERCNYGYNAQLDGMAEKDISPDTVLFFEIEGGWDVSGGRELMINKSRHGRVFVVAFADGSVQQVSQARLAELKWNP